MSSRSVLAVHLVLASLAAPMAYAQSPTLTSVMNQKADNAQRLLRPLVVGDFLRLEESVERLARLTYTEVASWQTQPDQNYVKQAMAFVEAVQGLRKATRGRNLDEASTHYAALIASCVGCHRHVGRTQSVSFRPPAPTVEIPPAR